MIYRGLALLLLVLSVVACNAAPVTTEPPTPTLPPITEAPATDTPQPADGPACETHTASMALTTSAAAVEVGEPVIIRVTLNNEGCVALGLPQYRLLIDSDQAEPILAPAEPEPVIHYLGVAPGQADSAEFKLSAAAPGQVGLTASASFEVHIGYPGPAYWGSSSSGEPLILTVNP